jgi:voltage-gated potassium channel
MVEQRSRRTPEAAAAMEERFRKPMYAVALLVIPAIILTSVSVPEPWHTVGEILNWLTWAAFAVEMVVMLRVVPSRWRYLAANPIDVIVVVFSFPLLASVFTSLRALRLLRLLRILRLEPIVRWMFSSGGLRYAALFALLTAVSAGYGYSQLEGEDLWTGVYWSVTTMTTVGYGDVLPTHAETQVLAIVVMLVGIGFVAVLTGALAERFLSSEAEQLVEADERHALTDAELLQRIDALTIQVGALRAALADGRAGGG